MKDPKQNAEITRQLHELYQKAGPALFKAFREANNGREAPGMIEYGIVDEDAYDAQNGILIVLKEANDWSAEDFQESVTYADYVRDLIDGKHPRSAMWYNLSRWVSVIRDPGRPTDEVAELYEAAVQELRSVAFTNVNKVTGGASVNAAYYAVAQSKAALDTLREEIRILDPKIVLFCGTAWLLGEDGLDRLRAEGRKVLDLWHPGARKRKTMMIDAVKQQLREEG